jgi:hypothetical protein
VPETFKSVEQFVDETAGSLDTAPVFARLQDIVQKGFDKVSGHFELTRDPSTDRFEDYGKDAGLDATVRGYTGPQVDWLIRSWVANHAVSFTNLHLTVWLGPQVKVPHLGIALGTFPVPWCYLDLVPRSDLMVDTESLDRYYEPLNEEHLEIRARKDVDPFVSRALYVREALSETAHCFSTPDVDAGITLIGELVERTVDRWLRYVDEAEPTPQGERRALAERDLAVRRNVAERDPANSMGVRFFGEETTDALVRALWGGDRTTTRPGV